MQPIDPDDPRKAYVKVAASVRAAILSGELEPGAQLPTGEELAQHFDVSRNTIISAVRILRDEGFIRTTPGGGMYVQRQAALPVAEEHPLAPVASYIFEIGFLKHTPRTGWLMLGIPDPESVAEHSFRAAVIGITLASMEGADIGRTVAMCVLHDTAETRLSDIASVSRAYLAAARPEAVSAHQTDGMPDSAKDAHRELVAEFEAGVTLEARCARDADKLELLATAREYERQGYDTAEWQQTSSEALRTKSGQWLGQAVLTTSPVWWKAFADSYHEIKAAAKNRGK